ncbi:MAG: hypothetical protein IJ678_07300, partial [Kiritimatiellae bacterium]|nr:hypothetical protein [Kiritimatiellia bacterium]
DGRHAVAAIDQHKRGAAAGGRGIGEERRQRFRLGGEAGLECDFDARPGVAGLVGLEERGGAGGDL